MPEYMYGVREDGSIVSIRDIDLTESGLRCKCKCPKCHRDLQACSLLEKKVRRYFRHNNDGYDREGISNLNGCTATSANESGLHMMAKELIAESRKIAFPPMSLSLEQLNLPFSADILSQLPESTLLRPAFLFECSEIVEVEKPYPQFRPDVSVSGDGETFLIEIAVTHKVNRDKQEKVEHLGLPMLEIDLSDYVETGISRDDLRNIISVETDHKKWITLSKSLVDDIRCKLTQQAEGIQKRIEALENRRKESFTPKNYSARLSASHNDYAFDQYAKRNIHFDTTHTDYPFFINIPISGEVIFKCDRRVWQGKIFDRWIYHRTGDSINIFSIWSSLTKENHISYDPILDGKFLYPSKDQPSYLPYEVIRKYLGYLELLGFISIQGQWATVIQKHSLVPPDPENAVHLKSVLAQADGYSPTVSAFIDQKLRAILQAEQERKAALEQERLRQEALQKQLQDEAQKRAAEKEAQRQREALEKAIQTADYDQTESDIIIGNRRWLLCTVCNYIVNSDSMAACGFPTRNKGICCNCARHLK